ncbi:MAG: hypothetical protein Q7K55_08970 [Candidatus Levybacteria bacterium]|nr:hypothetical protein [Candidatus Levybacteria bacterium]
MIDTANLVNIILQGGSFIAAFAAIAAGIIMASATKKFGTGILASGFKTIAIGVFFIAIGIIIDAFNSYLQILGSDILIVLLAAKEVLFVLGTYIIVIGSKKIGDKLESLTT